MATKKKKNPSPNNANKIRLSVTNWDNEVPVMMTKRSSRQTERKVVTKGIIRGFDQGEEIAAEEAAVLKRIATALRAGYEYRMVDENGEEAVRFIPCVERDMKTVSIIAQTMGSFRGSLNDKEVKPFFHGEEVPRSKAAKVIAKSMEKDREYTNKRHHVTPDTVVTCPNCGSEFRVGKELG